MERNIINIVDYWNYRRSKLFIPDRPKGKLLKFRKIEQTSHTSHNQCPFCNMVPYNEETRQWVKEARQISELMSRFLELQDEVLDLNSQLL